MKRILIIEDDTDLQEGLAFTLAAEGYDIAEADSIRAAKRQLVEGRFDCLLLDCNLPDGSGFELCGQIRETSRIPILMLTARDTELDEVRALELGVDDYMSKPFSAAVLKARLKKLMNRGEELTTYLDSNGIRLDKGACRVYQGEKAVELSKVEYKLLLYFMENKNQVLSKEQILRHIWDSEGKFVDENIVSVNIRRLRRKIEVDPAAPRLIRTVHGLGYMWKD
ncbi:response regulator transcription factor [Bariatricus massiliensis]|uniref:Stage 0 sporulation protein A homolog n=1 Tax=Bariatricus massiliensis TaxID=1745713 RepID=A0ABS8DGV4_9FIRM|nr:response regulator transcription factor [Bariatricus massiliensis]MCB7303929.1 response regulator transcription factor [Bariatricus massiliensis]MCB7374640.1 response regulator transcription factor [Bariatricus massiliensis]MCB7387039.1 response regulator transcription factor [Bariatricus massiliensis]MCB7411201.1 response regulator transcription factor [Bariatricus massiliensis]MCQ5252855.1 response regulator transcription factor [Bariatricus massiliensis]